METNYHWAKSFRSFLNESEGNIESAESIAELIINSTHEEENIPHYFIDKILTSGKQFILTKLRISDILESDEAVAEYVEAGEERYEDLDYDYELGGVDQPIIIFEGEVLDGYNRILVNYQNGEEFINAWVSID